MLTEPVFRASTYILTLAIPTYNGGNRINPLLLSLKAHGYLDNTDIEVLIANNCSTDHTAELLNSLPLAYSVIHNTSNIGFPGNLVKLMVYAKGRYIWFLGDDDEVRIHSRVILSALSSLSGPHLLASREEYLAVHSRKKAAPVIPFGFISSTIQPNTDCLLDSTIKYSDNPHHSSPHFFARWEFFLRNGPACLAELPSADFLAGRPVTASPTTFKELKKRIHTLLTPWVSRHYCWNWYNALRVAKANKQLHRLELHLRSAETGFFLTQLQTKPTWTLIYWLEHIPFLLFKDLGYGLYLYGRLATASVLFAAGRMPFFPRFLCSRDA